MENASGGIASPRIVLSGLALGLAALVLATGGRAADPAAGTIGPAAPETAWQGETYTLARIAGPEACPAEDPDDATCDHFTLTVDVEPTYWDTHDGGVRVRISWPNPADDFDFYVYDASGNEVGRGATGPSNVEEAFVPEPSGTLKILVVPFLVTSSGYSGTASFESTATTASGPGPYYLHGEPTDDAAKLPGPPDPTATFDTSEPTDPAPASQGTTAVANEDFAKNLLAAFWTGDFSGPIDGSLELTWWWSSGGAAATGAQVSVTVFADAPADGGVVPPEQILGRRQITLTAGPTPVENVAVVPVKGNVVGELTVQVALLTATASDVRVHYDSPEFPSRFLVTDRQPPVQNTTPPGVDGLASAPAQGLAFSASVPAEHQRDEAEPLIEINKDGHLFTCGPTGFSNASDYAQVSTDGGDQFHLLGTPPRGQQGAGGGGDCGMAFGTTRNAQGHYQYAYTGLGPLTGFVTSTSPNNGRNLVTGGPFGNGVTDEGGGADRQWNVFVDDHTVLLNYNQQVPRNVVIQRSTDGGLTYGPDSVVAAPTPLFPGPLRYDEANDVVFFPWDSFENHINLSISRDKGLTWTACLVAVNDAPAAGFATADVDREGNLYVAWAVEGSYHTYMSSLPAAKVAECDDPVTPNGPQPTTDPGWLTPVQVDRDAVRTTVFPWLAAGGASGRVAVTFYGTDQDGDPNLGTFKGAWDVYVNQSLNGLAADATFSQVKASSHPFHYDSICLNGLGCDLAVPPGDRTLADFFAIDYNPKLDRLSVVFNRTNKLPDEALGHVANVMVVNQIGGPTLGGALVTPTRPAVRTSTTDPAGDALSSYSLLGPPSPPPPTANEPAADFLSVALGPEIDLHNGQPVAGGGFTATLKVADLSNAALLATATRTAAQSLLWLVRFSNGHQDVAASARWNPVEGFTFGYNDYSVASAQCGSSGEKCVVYPGGTPIQGDVDQAKGVIRLSVPRFLLRALGPADASGRPTEVPATDGSRLYDVTAISVANNVSPVQVLQSFLYPLDAAASMDYLLGSGGGGGGGGETGCAVSGGGSIAAGSGEGKFSVDVHVDGKGKVDYRDGDTDFRSSGRVVLLCTGKTARVEGSGFVDRDKPVTFTVDVADNGESGATDTFSISLGNGKAASGTLTRGNIQVKLR